MPWHDVCIVIYGESAQDLARHFIEYWNHAKIDYEGTRNKKEGTFLKPVKIASESTVSSKIMEVNQSSDSDDYAETETEGMIGKGMSKYVKEEIKEGEEEEESSIYKIQKIYQRKALIQNL